MKKTNLIILIGGLIIILIIAAGVSVWLLKQPEEKPVVTPPVEMPETITTVEERILSRWLAANPNEIPGVYKEKVELFKNKLKNECLAKKENVKQFLLAMKNDADTANLLDDLLNEMKEIAIPLDLLPLKTSPEGKDLGFEIHKYAVLECYNLDKDEFKQCQGKLNGLEINNKNTEETVLAKIDNYPQFFPALPEYLQCKAVEQRDKNLCSKFFYLSSDYDYLSNCQDNVGRFNFMTSVYFQPNCENLCQKEKVDIDEKFTVGDCLTLCQAIKNSDVNECLKLQDKNEQLFCSAYVTLDSNNCQKIEPKILEVKESDGRVVKENQVADCLSMTLLYKSIKENNPDILKGVKTEAKFSLDFINYLKKLYFGNEGCERDEKDFYRLYENYCNLKYSS